VPANDDLTKKQRDFVANQLKKLNPNVDVPVPKIVTLNKAAIDLVEFDEARDAWRTR
jgi:hypothetical protein